MHALWTGALSFGLITIPIRLYNATQDRSLHLHLLEKNTLCPISYARICRRDNREIKWEDIVKGYEYSKGDYVILLDEDFKRANPKKTKTVEVMNFVEKKEIDPLYIEKPYFVEPDETSEKAYVLLREALKKSKKVAVCQFVIRHRQHLGIIEPINDVLMLVQLRYKDELRGPKGLNVPTTKKFSKQEFDVALMLIDQLSGPFKAGNYSDTYTEDLKRIIEIKASGKKFKKVESAPQITQTKDLMAMLKKSLEQEQKRPRSERQKVGKK